MKLSGLPRTFGRFTSSDARQFQLLLKFPTDTMRHPRIAYQFICLTKKHMSSPVMKILCVSCKQHRFFCWSRRHITRRDDVDGIKSSAQILWDYLRIDSPLKKVVNLLCVLFYASFVLLVYD